MNKQEKLFFAALSKDRTDSADVLEKPSINVEDSVVEKYSDQAHFIYELLQNADDVHATRARFILEPTRLIFAHNGTEHFSLSDPDPVKEKSDRKAGTLGHINAITSIGNSNKPKAKIGKFGVGFKAVFQYTATPHIYDPNFRFKIERFIVPIQLDEDFPARHPDETLFVFPFDHPKRDAVEAYKDISDKLRNLSFPLLFLSSLKDIEFEFGNVIGLYGKSTKKTYSFDGIIAEHICLTQNDGDDLYDENLWLFSRLDDNQSRYSVGFFLDEHGHLRPVNETAFCFFPTKEVTGLNFIIHAPFLLTDSREGIHAGESHNDRMVKLLADLAARAIVLLREIGERESMRLIDDSILDIIPYDPGKFSDPNNKSKISFFPFYESIREVFEKEEILPSIGGYVSSENAYWASAPQIIQLFSNQQLSGICDNISACWVFPSIGRDDTQSANRTLFTYVDSLVKTNLNDDAIISGRSRSSFYNRYLGEYQSLEPVKGITASFIEDQPIPWLHKFYKWLSDSKVRTKAIGKKPIFLDQHGKAVAAFDKAGQPILFLPVENISGYAVVHPTLLENSDTSSFIKEIGVKPPSLRDHIYNIILPLYENGGTIDTDSHFKLFFDYYCKCSNDEVDDFIDLIKKCEFLTYYIADDPQPYCGAASTMYLPTPDLIRFFAPKQESRFVALEKYLELVGTSKERQLISFLSELGVRKDAAIFKKAVDGYYHKETESFIDGLLELINSVEQKADIGDSVFLWEQLCLLADGEILSQNVLHKTVSSRPDGRYNFRNSYEDSKTAISLKSKHWIVNSEGIFVSPGEITKNTLLSEYNLALDGALLLLSILDIRDDIPSEGINKEGNNSYLTDEQREKIEFADKLKAMGIDESDLEELRRIKQQRETSRQATGQRRESSRADSAQPGIDTSNIDDLLDNLDFPTDEATIEHSQQHRKLNKATSDVVKDIARRTKETPTVPSLDENMAEEEFDQDEYMPSPVDYSKRIERAKKKRR